MSIQTSDRPFDRVSVRSSVHPRKRCSERPTSTLVSLGGSLVLPWWIPNNALDFRSEFGLRMCFTEFRDCLIDVLSLKGELGKLLSTNTDCCQLSSTRFSDLDESDGL